METLAGNLQLRSEHAWAAVAPGQAGPGLSCFRPAASVHRRDRWAPSRPELRDDPARPLDAWRQREAVALDRLAQQFGEDRRVVVGQVVGH
jgi:hypothetical protein